jgi:hypothetical protein
VLAPTIPTSRASATRQIRSESWEKKYPARPTSELLASAFGCQRVHGRRGHSTHNDLLFGLEPNQSREGTESLLPVKQLRRNQHTVDRSDADGPAHSHIPSTRLRGR